MKAYINIKNDSDLHSHQTLNKRIGLMKRERQHNAAHRFSFGKRFDETMMKYYFACYQYIRPSNHQFIGFSPLNKSAGNMAEVTTVIRRLVGRTSGLPTDRGKADVDGEKKRATNIPNITADTAAGFWDTKSHSSLGRFLHAPLTLMLKTPNEPTGLHPSGHPRLSCAAQPQTDGYRQTSL